MRDRLRELLLQYREQFKSFPDTPPPTLHPPEFPMIIAFQGADLHGSPFHFTES
jgi:hypothetical protein